MEPNEPVPTGSGRRRGGCHRTAMSHPVFANVLDASGAGPDSRLPAPLEEEIRAIYRRSPLYPERFPLHPEPLHWACYRDIPVLTKQEILQRGPAAFFADYRVIERG